MNNSDMPAMPLTEEQIDHSERGNGYGGLTKREYFAAKALQGLLAAHTAGCEGEVEFLPADAIRYADELLKQLEETN